MNFGALAGGTADGIQAGSTLADQALSRHLKQQQLQEYLNAQAGQRAFTNMAIPGMGAMPGTPQQPGSGLPTMMQLPIVGPIARGFQDAGNAFGDLLGFGSGSPAQGGSMPPVPTPSAGPSMASSQPAAQPAPAQEGAPAAAPILPGMETMQKVAQAIDKANPGLRTQNPQAFAQAVEIAMKRVNDYQAAQLEAGKTGAEVSRLNAQTKAEESKVPLNESRSKYYDARAKNPPGGGNPIKELNQQIQHELTNNAVMLRHYENENAQILQAPIQSPAMKAQYTENKRYIDAHRARDKILRSQLPTASLGEAKKPNTGTDSVKAVELPAQKKKALQMPLEKLVSFGGEPAQTTKFVKFLQSKGVPQEEINYLLMEAKSRLSAQAEAPAVSIPMSR